MPVDSFMRVYPTVTNRIRTANDVKAVNPITNARLLNFVEVTTFIVVVIRNFMTLANKLKIVTAVDMIIRVG